MITVCEIFHSIQGESLDAGRPCVFVRLSGCNLRCGYCDTRYAWDGGEVMALTDILERVTRYGCRLVAVTGGEPLLQAETPLLIRNLLDQGFEVLLETNGSYDIGAVDARCVKILDVKCPGSGMADRMDMDNLGRLGERDQLKFVLTDRADYEYAKSLVGSPGIAGIAGRRLLFSPAAPGMKPAQLAEWILEDRLDVRFQVQLHRILWPDVERGV
ncbi:MAG: radical SAM protein [Thermodesulfobacteriota bacterium]